MWHGGGMRRMLNVIVNRRPVARFTIDHSESDEVPVAGAGASRLYRCT